MLKEKDLKYLEEVKKYGTKLLRYDLVEDDKIDNTKSIIKYQYKDEDVYIVMEKGECIDYFKKQTTIIADKRTEQDFLNYERVRQSGLYNMLDIRARQATGLTEDRYFYIIKHYSELRDLYIKE